MICISLGVIDREQPDGIDDLTLKRSFEACIGFYCMHVHEHAIDIDNPISTFLHKY